MHGHVSNKSVTLHEITIMNSLASSTKSFKIWLMANWVALLYLVHTSYKLQNETK